MALRIKLAFALAFMVAGLLVAGCSPEASRTRSGGPGADVGNRGRPVEMHGKTDPGFNTPRVGQAIAK